MNESFNLQTLKTTSVRKLINVINYLHIFKKHITVSLGY